MSGKYFWGFGIIEDIFQIVFSAAELNLGEQIYKNREKIHEIKDKMLKSANLFPNYIYDGRARSQWANI